MEDPELARALAAARSTASALGLTADDAVVVNNSNTLIARLLPADVLARVTPVEHQVAQFEIDIARGLAEYGSPVAALDPRVGPRVYERDGFVVTLWTYYEPAPTQEIDPADYADALGRLHAGLRRLDVPAPHVRDRVEEARRIVASPDVSPELADADRELLDSTLARLGRMVGERGAQQLLHGEPHPGNLLATTDGLRFIDFETCCRGPVEFDLAHAPEAVADHYPGLDRELLRECRLLMLAMIIAWRWEPGDQLPNGRQLGTEWLNQLRTALDPRAFNGAGDPGGAA